MLKFLKSIPPLNINHIKFVFSIAILLSIYNLVNLNNKYIANSKLPLSQIISNIGSEYILSFIVISFFLMLFTPSKILLKIVSVILVGLSGSFIYFIYNYSIIIDEILISAIFETSSEESNGFISFGSIMSLIIFALIPNLYIIFYVKIHNKEGLIKILVKFIYYMFFLLILYIISNQLNPTIYKDDRTIKTSLSSFMPMNYISGIYLYFKELRGDYATQLIDISKNEFTQDGKILNNNKINVILIIGESARADHQSLNGYHLNTNPLLSKQKDLINFPYVYSCGTNSRHSIACMLSHSIREEFSFPSKTNNIFSIFNKINFNTSFLTNHSVYEKRSQESGKRNLINIAISDASNKVFINTVRTIVPSGENPYDEYLLPFLNKAISNNKNNFVVLYLMGSHTPYGKRYPEKFNQFQCKSPCGQQEKMIAEYDNTILYTDYILNSIIENIKNNHKDDLTLLYYVSDHAENLGENNLYIHGHIYDRVNNPYLIHVPQFIWVSKSLEDKLKNKYQNIIKNSKKEISQDYVFNSLLDCIGIGNSVLINKNLSICN